MAAAWQARQQQLTELTRWSLNGRFAIQDGEDAWNGVIQWRQTGEQFDIRFIAPFGQGSVELRGGALGALLRLSDSESYLADSAETLLQEHVGWRVPVADLRRWVLGLPGPDEVIAQQLDEYARLQSLEQSGWQVRFMRYTQSGDHELPDKIFINNHRLKLRLVVDEWQLQ